MNATIEIWKLVVGWPKYQVSNFGNVKGHYGRVLNPRVGTNGYLRISARNNGRAADLYIHRMVLEAFVGAAPADKPEADHINRDRSNNQLSNLRWSTVADNRANRTVYRGESNIRSILTLDAVNEIRTAQKSDREYAESFGVSRRYVNAVRNGRNWNWVGNHAS